MPHASHCCIIHGCKYGDHDTCPVCLAKIKQDYLCQTCYDYIYDELKTTSELNNKINKEFLKRNRLYKLNKISKKSKK
jgi:hypothetical protein